LFAVRCGREIRIPRSSIERDDRAAELAAAARAARLDGLRLARAAMAEALAQLDEAVVAVLDGRGPQDGAS
jgi:hypothetical protein